MSRHPAADAILGPYRAPGVVWDELTGDGPQLARRVLALVDRCSTPGVWWVARLAGPPAAVRYLMAVAGAASPVLRLPGGDPRLAALVDSGDSDHVLLLALSDAGGVDGVAALLERDELGQAVAAARMAVVLSPGQGRAGLTRRPGVEPPPPGAWSQPQPGRAAPGGTVGVRRRRIAAALLAVGLTGVATVGAVRLRPAATPPRVTAAATAAAIAPTPASTAPRRYLSIPAAQLPRSRQGAGIAVFGRAVLVFGGVANGPPRNSESPAGVALGDTWTWDAVHGWGSSADTGAPPPRGFAGMAYSPVQVAVILFGGLGGSDTAPPGADTWQWDGHWQRLHPAHSPPAGEAGMVWDERDRVMLMVDAPVAPDGSLLPVQTWTWDGVDWHRATARRVPPVLGPLAYDPGTGAVLMLTPPGQPSGQSSSTWTWSGSQWTERVSTAAPPFDPGATLAADPGDHGVLLFVGGGASSQTWRWRGGVWSELSPTSAPATATAMVTTDDGVLLFGGELRSEPFTEIAGWTGGNWQLLYRATAR
ncbi:MAG: hypothetical protein E6J14_00450 [Chloroflexi bacterium]|nr:MAG: hypothetical protein E6J14_00450 [Chloroflexota bacterium]